MDVPARGDLSQLVPPPVRLIAGRPRQQASKSSGVPRDGSTSTGGAGASPVCAGNSGHGGLPQPPRPRLKKSTGGHSNRRAFGEQRLLEQAAGGLCPFEQKLNVLSQEFSTVDKKVLSFLLQCAGMVDEEVSRVLSKRATLVGLQHWCPEERELSHVFAEIVVHDVRHLLLHEYDKLVDALVAAKRAAGVSPRTAVAPSEPEPLCGDASPESQTDFDAEASMSVDETAAVDPVMPGASPKDVVTDAKAKFHRHLVGLKARELRSGHYRGTREQDERLERETLEWMLSTGQCVNLQPLIGGVPGVDVLDQFHATSELAACGVHRCHEGVKLRDMSLGDGVDEEVRDELAELNPESSLALSILVHARNSKDRESISFTIGASASNVLQSLQNNFHHGIPLRVVRFDEDVNSPSGSVYVYDGLYIVQARSPEKRGSSCVFVFTVVRLPGQPTESFPSVSRSCNTVLNVSLPEDTGRCFVVDKDVSRGAERARKIPVVNTVDSTPSPAGSFEYLSSYKFTGSIVPSGQRFKSCECEDCWTKPSCPCRKLNGGVPAYLPNGQLVEDKPMESNAFILECSQRCCSRSDCSRVGQRGIRYRLELFRTADSGWGVWSLDTIPYGAFVSLYIGKVIPSTEDVEDDTYLLDIDYGGEKKPIYSIDAFDGNVGRFFNHSCDPNMYTQYVMCDEHGDESLPSIALFASRNIPPFTELTWDYAYREDLQTGKVIMCNCGAEGCRKRLI